MGLYFHVFCAKLTNSQIACSGIYYLDLPFILLANRRSKLSGTNQLDLPFVFLLNEVHLLFKGQ